MASAILDQERLVSMGRCTSASLSPDGRELVVAVQRLDEVNQSKYTSDLWSVSTDGLWTPRPMTRGKYNDHSPTHDRDGNLLFASNRPTSEQPEEGAEERSQIWLLPARGGEPVPLTDEPLGVSSFRVASDADVIVMLTDRLPDVPEGEQRATYADRSKHGPSARIYRDMPIRDWDHWIPARAPQVAIWRDGTSKVLSSGEDRRYRGCDFAISSNGAMVAVGARHTQAEDRIEDACIELFDTSSGVKTILLVRERTQLSPICFVENDAFLLVHAWRRVDGDPGPRDLLEIDLSTGKARTIALDLDIWPTIETSSDDGSILYATADYQGATPIFAITRATGQVERVSSESSGGSHWNVQRDGGRLIGLRSSILEPPHPFLIEADGEQTPKPLANLSGVTIDRDAVEVTSHHAPTTDGGSCQYYVIKPTRAGDAPLPVVTWVHGGPISSWGDIWHWRWNSLVGADRGYMMVLPNPRGSTGFGTPWVEGIWGDVWGGQCYEDVMIVVDAVAAREDARGDAMALMGGSFGGYMTNWIGTQEDRFSCLITHAGLYNLQLFHSVTDHPAYWQFMLGDDPYANTEAFTRYSPHRHIANWKSPTLVIHGQQDYRVPIGEAMALFGALQAHDVESEFLLYPDENHWILKPRNIKSWYGEVFRFIDQHMPEESA